MIEPAAPAATDTDVVDCCGGGPTPPKFKAASDSCDPSSSASISSSPGSGSSSTTSLGAEVGTRAGVKCGAGGSAGVATGTSAAGGAAADVALLRQLIRLVRAAGPATSTTALRQSSISVPPANTGRIDSPASSGRPSTASKVAALITHPRNPVLRPPDDRSIWRSSTASCSPLLISPAPSIRSRPVDTSKSSASSRNVMPRLPSCFSAGGQCSSQSHVRSPRSSSLSWSFRVTCSRSALASGSYEAPSGRQPKGYSGFSCIGVTPAWCPCRCRNAPC